MTETLDDLRDENAMLRDIIVGLTAGAEPPLDGLTIMQSRVARTIEHAAGRILTRGNLITGLYWDRHCEPIDKIIDIFICHIRRLRPDIGAHIVTVWGVGYRWEG